MWQGWLTVKEIINAALKIEFKTLRDVRGRAQTKDDSSDHHPDW